MTILHKINIIQTKRNLLEFTYSQILFNSSIYSHIIIHVYPCEDVRVCAAHAFSR